MDPNSCTPSGPGAYPSDCEVREGYRKIAREKAMHNNRSENWQVTLSKAKDIKLLLLDVDGVLTDGNLIYSHEGKESKSFNTQDGFGLRMLQDAGVEVGIITARSSEALERRASDLKISHLYQGAANKLIAYQEIVKKTGLKPFQIAYMGDDWLDMVLLKRVGLSLAPANGVLEVKEMVHYTTEQSGGHGAVREACNLILEGLGKYNELLQGYLTRC
ncbi:3-deoxy-D-manno-octulosonate 8-phosphate phosphatase, YrbI family [Desulfocapsa sulfexigens DSM 10523]|uniref:3-deoxy-D-manno-octulosonate 8-phosphate phosphatase, YrbI family n=1 Tax=Desulfocapsa sulfexigens (strain DSM 10523 / SB164P1) TaxID=1167006 RepID=M1P1X3_DESSD|nr:HAD hydrolase family protein [Desulfocapsa sulfexigens]AGF77473.1 3-deoxy-D-manno-octulosonate 8-phosphate phosphatase, YrbI family [Desulfocapsa sulfexigens DSM 10523]